MAFLYNFIILPFLMVIKAFVQPFNKKLKEREGMWEDVLDEFLEIESKFTGKRVWFHAASMGEFEQAKPVIEQIKADNTDIHVIVSFYSPSGYNNQKDYEFADAVLYMPIDLGQNARYFINSIKPDIAVFVRYEIWYNHLSYLNRRHIPTLLICATMPGSSAMRENFLLRSFLKKSYRLFTSIYTINEQQTEFFRKLGIEHVETLTDTRFDRIAKTVDLARRNPILGRNFIREDDFILVAGSSWQPCEKMIIDSYVSIQEYKDKKIKLVLVPHEPTEEHINDLVMQLGKYVLLSEYENNPNEDYSDTQIMVVDGIGKLLKLYSSADAAYIGGGFGVGIHSVTEPAGYGIPLSTGPKIDNSPDAVQLHKQGAISIVENADSFSNWMKLLIDNPEETGRIGKIAHDFVHKQKGSSEKIARAIEKYLRVN
jgi:3-deoxy-D-manno-octulosonic-acid transferase